MELIETQVVMLPKSEGGRATPLSNKAFNGQYRPHLVIGNPSQRKTTIVNEEHHPKVLTENYQGVAFVSGPKLNIIPCNEKIKIIMALIYFPNMSYSEVIENATFTLREGPKIVGYGKILKRWHEEVI